VPFGSRILVKKQFMVHPIPDHRVNIIGFTTQNVRDEAGLPVTRNDCLQRFSIDRDGKIFRIEVYKQGKFNGMVLADFRFQGKSDSIAHVRVSGNIRKKKHLFR
ncbi:MAG: hypothetical protein MI799_00585, partial [Desulfobacterales bacterium]|nr:hypothetical protein [Desulfobacterales bacterium]